MNRNTSPTEGCGNRFGFAPRICNSVGAENDCLEGILIWNGKQILQSAGNGSYPAGWARRIQISQRPESAIKSVIGKRDAWGDAGFEFVAHPGLREIQPV